MQYENEYSNAVGDVLHKLSFVVHIESTVLFVPGTKFVYTFQQANLPEH